MDSKLVYSQEKELAIEELEPEVIPPLLLLLPNYKDTDPPSVGPCIESLRNLVAVLGVSKEIAQVAILPASPSDYIGNRKQFTTAIWPQVLKNRYKLIIPFGPMATYPFFEKDITANPDWFDTYHTRLHEKKASPAGQDPLSFFLYPLPDLSVASADKVTRDVFDRQLRVLRGLLYELEVLRKAP